MLHEALADYLRRVEQAVLRCRNAYVERYVEEILAPERLNLRIRLRFEAGHLLEIDEAVVIEDGALVAVGAVPGAARAEARGARVAGADSRFLPAFAGMTGNDGGERDGRRGGALWEHGCPAGSGGGRAASGSAAATLTLSFTGDFSVPATSRPRSPCG